MSYSFVLILVFSVHAYGLNEIAANSSSIFEAKNITCDIHNFIYSINARTDNDYQQIVSDISTYCLQSDSIQSNRLICQMVFLELQIGCLLLNRTRHTPIRYNIQHTPRQICSLPKVTLVNSWIEKHLSKREKDLIGSSVMHLCSVVTMSNDTLRLARFFYRTAPKIRRIDLAGSRLQANQTSAIATNAKKEVIQNQTNPEEMHQEKIMEENGRNQKVLDNSPEELNVNKSQSVNEIKADGKQLMAEGENTEEKKIFLRKKPTNETKQSEEGVPLGRAGEQPEREQVNERPKPKPLDPNVMFKQNPRDERNWIDGKNSENKVEDSLHINLNHMQKEKVDENPIIAPKPVKKRGPFRLKLSRHSNDDDESDDLSNSFVTTVLVVVLCIVLIYLILHNKNKVLGLVVEGCKRKRTTSRHIRLTHSID